MIMKVILNTGSKGPRYRCPRWPIKFLLSSGDFRGDLFLPAVKRSWPYGRNGTVLSMDQIQGFLRRWEPSRINLTTSLWEIGTQRPRGFPSKKSSLLLDLHTQQAKYGPLWATRSPSDPLSEHGERRSRKIFHIRNSKCRSKWSSIEANFNTLF